MESGYSRDARKKLGALMDAMDEARKALPVPAPDRLSPSLSDYGELYVSLATWKLKLTNMLEKDGYEVGANRRGWEVRARKASKSGSR
jgi:hypothetical protein